MSSSCPSAKTKHRRNPLPRTATSCRYSHADQISTRLGLSWCPVSPPDKGLGFVRIPLPPGLRLPYLPCSRRHLTPRLPRSRSRGERSPCRSSVATPNPSPARLDGFPVFTSSVCIRIATVSDHDAPVSSRRERESAPRRRLKRPKMLDFASVRYDFAQPVGTPPFPVNGRGSEEPSFAYYPCGLPADLPARGNRVSHTHA
jgi:hypothetical protein